MESIKTESDKEKNTFTAYYKMTFRDKCDILFNGYVRIWTMGNCSFTVNIGKRGRPFNELK
jgi:hypothetical protein